MNFETMPLWERRFYEGIRDILEKANLSPVEKERVNESAGPGKVLAGWIETNRKPNLYANEEVCSVYGYPQAYKPKNIRDQEMILRKSFRNMGTRDDDLEQLAKRSLPPNTEWTLIPRWEKIGETYHEALIKVLELIGLEREFCNSLKDRLGEKFLQQTDRSVEFWKKIGDRQTGDFLLLPTQFGVGHRGKSTRRARERMNQSEFGLGAFACACMLLTHPEREGPLSKLHVDCAGDQYSPDGNHCFEHTPIFKYQDKKLVFGSGAFDNFTTEFGSPSGFLN